MIDIYAYDTTEQGFKALSLEFNGAAVLLKRPDLAKSLLAYYKNTNCLFITFSSDSNSSYFFVYANDIVDIDGTKYKSKDSIFDAINEIYLQK